MLKHMFFNIPNSGVSESNWNASKGDWKDGKMLQFNQSEFIKESNSAMPDFGQLYVPESCSEHSKKCHLHIYFHTCKDIGDHDQIKHQYKDLISYANSNNIVLLLPEADHCWNTHTNWGTNAKKYP